MGQAAFARRFPFDARLAPEDRAPWVPPLDQQKGRTFETLAAFSGCEKRKLYRVGPNFGAILGLS